MYSALSGLENILQEKEIGNRRRIGKNAMNSRHGMVHMMYMMNMVDMVDIMS